MKADHWLYSNKSTSIYVQIFGVLVGLGGALHGVFEVFQGNKPTGGLVLADIGALTLIPNYRATGIAAIIAGLLVIIWSVGFINHKLWPPVFLGLCLLLFFVGGGFAQVLIILIAWVVSTQIHKPLSWWKKRISHRTRSIFARLWLPLLILGVLFFTVGFGVWLLVLPPGEIREVTPAHYFVWASLLVGTLFLLLDIVFGFSRDIELRG